MVCNTITREPYYESTDRKYVNKKSIKKGWILSEKQMDSLRNKPYMYNCYVGSIMELLFLQKFWYFISRYVPSSIAPCTLTCTGLLINVLSCTTLLFYSPDAKQTTPYWTFFVCGIGLFLYQIFDALDGKQAVKVQDTPIEEVYDHGCDAVSALFITQSVAVATRLGYHPFMQFVFFLMPLIAFYFTHFSCHVTHVMVFGRMDVIEGQWAMIIIHLLTSLFGQDIWSYEIYENIMIKHILFVLTMLALMSSIVTNILLILGRESPLDSYVRIPRKKDNSKWNPSVSLIIIIISAIIANNKGVFEINSILFIFIYGLAFAKLSFKLQMMNVTHGNMSKFDSVLIGPLILTINSFIQLIDTQTLMIVILFSILLDYIIYFVLLSFDMKKALDLNIFSLKYPIGHNKCRNKNYGFNVNGTENEQAFRNMNAANDILSDVYDS